MKKVVLWFCGTGILLGLFVFGLDEATKYAETTSFDTCCMDVFYSRMLLLAGGGGMLGGGLGYVLVKLKDNLVRILLPVFQIIFWLVGYEGIHFLSKKLLHTSARGVDWGISVNYYFVSFSVIVILINVIASLFRRFEVLIVVISILLFSLIVFPTFKYYPYKTLLVLFLAAGSFILMPITSFFLRKRASIISRNNAVLCKSDKELFPERRNGR